MGLGFNLFLMWARGLTTLLLGDQVAVLASDVVRTYAVAPLPNSGARSCAGVYTFAAAPLPNSGARSVMWRGDCSECVRSVMSLNVCVVGDGYRPCTDGSRGPPFYF